MNTPAHSRQQRLEQVRAKRAWDDVQSVKTRPFAKKYKSLARGAAADIQTNGLGQTVGFWLSKRADEHGAISGHLSRWVSGQVCPAGTSHLMNWIMHPDTSTDAYRRATAEAMAYLAWLKRFAEAEIEGEPEDN